MDGGVEIVCRSLGVDDGKASRKEKRESDLSQVWKCKVQILPSEEGHK